MHNKTVNGITFTRVKNDVNGNPRYVCHYLNILTELEAKNTPAMLKYGVAIKRANNIGGRKFNNKQYGGGIVFSSYNLRELTGYIAESLR